MEKLKQSYTYELNSASFVSEKFDDDYVLLDTISGRYFDVSEKASIMFDEVLRGVDPVKIVETVYSSNADAGREAHIFLESLINENVIVPCDTVETVEMSDTAIAALSAEDGDFILGGFDDISELLIADPVHDIDPITGKMTLLGDATILA